MALSDLENPRQSGDHQGKCLFLLTQIKTKDKKQWKTLKHDYDEIDLDETWEFYQKLIKIYKEMPKTV